MARPYSEVTRLRSSTSASTPRACTTCLALSVKRQVLEISPGQLPSLRALPQLTRTRDGVALSCQRFSASRKRFEYVALYLGLAAYLAYMTHATHEMIAAAAR